MTFKDGTFDVILSNQCLHNISDDKERREACSEIARVLKPGGKLVLSDFINTAEYVHEFRKAGLKVETRSWYPFLKIIDAEEPAILR